jgi:hypothetical protein
MRRLLQAASVMNIILTWWVSYHKQVILQGIFQVVPHKGWGCLLLLFNDCMFLAWWWSKHVTFKYKNTVVLYWLLNIALCTFFLLYLISLRFAVVEIILKNVIVMTCYLITREPPGWFQRNFIFHVLIKEQRHKLFYLMVTFPNLFILIKITSRRDKLLSIDY